MPSESAAVECVYCGEYLLPSETGAHHTEEHPGKRYDPLWYFGDEGGDGPDAQ